MDTTKTEDTPTTEEPRKPYGAIELFERDSTVVFRTDKALEIISSCKRGEPLTEQLFMCLLVKQFLGHPNLLDDMAKELVDSGEVKKVDVDEIQGSTEE
tara:strand:- start:70 stop:366 length:297 start_codon:yes stop_codon:yes gene_type:complete